MSHTSQDHKRGFTIVEVVLVLAIAGLIFLMVFIALPALQRSQRDGQRRQDLGKVLTALQSYQTNNRNKLPGDDEWDAFKTEYLKPLDADGNSTGNFSDPSRGDYVFNVSDGDLEPYDDTTSATIYISKTYVCDGEKLKPSSAVKVAFRLRLEGGGIACISNS